MESTMAKAAKDRVYEERCAFIARKLREQGYLCMVLKDSEGGRSSNLSYLSGQSTDALLIVFCTGESVLVPWDINLSRLYTHAARVVPLVDYDCDYNRAAIELIKEGARAGAKGEYIALSPAIAHTDYMELSAALNSYTLRCDSAIYEELRLLRMVKAPWEIEAIRKATVPTYKVLEYLKASVRKGTLSECDIEGKIRRECYSYGCSGNSFESLVAGPTRSYAIHAYPNATEGPWGGEGLSLVDFGAKYEGYCSDVTFSVVRGDLTSRALTMLALVEEAFNLGLTLYRPGKCIREAAMAIESLFNSKGFSMPHGLGHGLGLDIHEPPFVSIRKSKGSQGEFASGMVVTLEPGLYDPEVGGVRLENDILITEDGNEVLTGSSILRL